MPIENEGVVNDDQDAITESTNEQGSSESAGAGDGTNLEQPSSTATEDKRQKEELDAFQAGVDSLKADGDAAAKKPDTDAAADARKSGKSPTAEQPAADPAKKDQAQAKQPDAEVEKEITGLALKGKAAERFREMAGEIKSSRPMIETLKGLNVADQPTLDAILKDAADGLRWEHMIQQSTASPQQLESAVGIIKAMNSGDPKIQGMALDAMLNECKNVAERLGRAIPGVTGDPLDKHADLKQAVEAMDITREHAMELAQARARDAAYQNRDQQTRQANEQRAQQQRIEQAESQRIDELSETLRASDPHFAYKLDVMKQSGVFDRIKSLPATDRYAAVLQAYRSVQAPVQQAATVQQPQRVRPGAVTNRGNNISADGVARKDFKNDVEAFEFGVASVSPR